jgi:hypothetical protein
MNFDLPKPLVVSLKYLTEKYNFYYLRCFVISNDITNLFKEIYKNKSSNIDTNKFEVFERATKEMLALKDRMEYALEEIKAIRNSLIYSLQERTHA